MFVSKESLLLLKQLSVSKTSNSPGKPHIVAQRLGLTGIFTYREGYGEDQHEIPFLSTWTVQGNPNYHSYPQNIPVCVFSWSLGSNGFAPWAATAAYWEGGASRLRLGNILPRKNTTALIPIPFQTFLDTVKGTSKVHFESSDNIAPMIPVFDVAYEKVLQVSHASH